MSAALQIIKGGNKSERRKQEKVSTRPHCKVSIDDVNWVRQQPPCVQQLWLDCIAAEQYGGAAHELDTNLSRNSFLKASAIIGGAGLFGFEEVRSKTQSGRSGITSYRVKNLHGYFNRHYWENFDNQSVTAESQAVTAGNQQMMPQSHQMMPECQILTFSEAEKLTQQEFQNPNYGANNSLTTYQQPTKVVGTVVSSDAPNENLHEGAIAPLGGASPQIVDSASESEEELPTVTDCTSLKLVDAIQGQSATLVDENQDCSEQPKTPHEDTCSAPQVEVVTSLDKWSDEAIVKRRELRPQRENKLKLASISGDNPGFNYLLECWEDVALWNKIKQLIGKYPEWGIACVEAKLVISSEMLRPTGLNICTHFSENTEHGRQPRIQNYTQKHLDTNQGRHSTAFTRPGN